MARVEKIGEEAVAVKGIIIEILHGACPESNRRVQDDTTSKCHSERSEES
jgi:hypothetical protein